MLNVRCSSLLLLLLSVTAHAQKKPNIIVILADDLGQRDLACYGSTFYETPHLDALAKSGMRFTDAYSACSVCSPTRAAMMTGKHPARLHLTDWLPGRKDAPNQKLKRPQIIDRLPLEEVTIAETLQKAGYATAHFGKWHLGPEGFFPQDQGFDLNIGGCHMGHPPSYFSPYKIAVLPDGPKGEYLTDRLTDDAIKFIQANKDKPFYIYFPHYAVHNPQQAKPEMVQRFKDKIGKPLPPDQEFGTEGKSRVRLLQNQPIYAANIAHMDESVGRIMQTLSDLKLDQNTIVIFTSDNGGVSTSEGYPTSNLPLRAAKGWNYEGGIRVPLIIRWPGVTKTGLTSAQPVMTTDYYPTLLEAAGLPLMPDQHKDGISIAPACRGENLPVRSLFWHYPHYSNQGGAPSAAIRSAKLKLVQWFEDSTIELYNLAEDSGEQTNLAANLPIETKALLDQLGAWQKEVNAQFPTMNESYDPNWKPGPARPNKQVKVQLPQD